MKGNARLVPVFLGTALGIAILAGACFPIRVPVRRAQEGIVVDDETGRPVSGARLIVESWQVPAPPGARFHGRLIHTQEVATDAAGRWRVPDEKDWAVVVLAADGVPLYALSACVIAPGYRTFVLDPWNSEERLPTIKIPQTIRLLQGPSLAPRQGKQASRCGNPLFQG